MEDKIKYKSDIVEKILKEASPVMQKKVNAKLKIAFKINEERKRRNWSKLQLAKHFNKNPSEITKWLSGVNNFTIDTLFEIEDGLKINLISIEDKLDKPKTHSRILTLKISNTDTEIPVINWPFIGGVMSVPEANTSKNTPFYKLSYGSTK